MRILVTGVTGQVGGALVARLKGLGTVVPANRAMLDLTRPADLSHALDDLAPDLIINPAAYTAVDKAEDERELAMRVNGDAPGAMARWAAARGVPLIHFSTDYVFDGSGERPWQEDDPPRPLSVYGASKLAGENEIRKANGPSLIVRTSWVYAASGANFLRTIARLASERDELRIVADQIGAPTSASLIANSIESIVAKSAANLPTKFAEANGLIHLTASGETSWYDFALSIVAGLRSRGVSLAVKRILPIRTDQYPTPATRPHNSRMDLDRLRRVFGITPPLWDMVLAIELDQLTLEFV
jgi:dTDP-4-dehydrorhamnose reductase